MRHPKVDKLAIAARTRLRGAFLAAAVLALTGCAATHIQRAEQLGSLGKAYADAVSAAGDEAMTTVVSFSLSEVKKERRGFAAGAEREKVIISEIDRLQLRQKLVNESDAQLALLSEYFSNLEAFAKQDVGASVEMATGGLTDSINALGQAIQKNPEAKAAFSDEERSAIAKLSGLVARQAHGQALARTLERDADMIGTQLKLLSKVLAQYADWIRTRNDMQLKDFYRDRIVKPFAASGDLPAGWDDDVRTYLAGRSISEQLSTAQAAGQRMERFWAGYLAGETSMAGMLAELKELQALLDAIAAYRKARAAG